MYRFILSPLSHHHFYDKKSWNFYCAKMGLLKNIYVYFWALSRTLLESRLGISIWFAWQSFSRDFLEDTNNISSISWFSKCNKKKGICPSRVSPIQVHWLITGSTTIIYIGMVGGGTLISPDSCLVWKSFVTNIYSYR